MYIPVQVVAGGGPNKKTIKESVQKMLLYLNCSCCRLTVILALHVCVSSSWCNGLICGLRLWLFLVIENIRWRYSTYK